MTVRHLVATITSVLLVMLGPGSASAAQGDTIRISERANGLGLNGNSFGPEMSADGRFVTFRSHASNLVGGDTNGRADIFVRDVTTGEVERVSVASDGTQAADSSFGPDISDDGRFVVFTSKAKNLVPNDANAQADIFVHDRETGETEIVSVATDGTQGSGESHDADISAGGRWVSFRSDAPNLVTGDTNGAWDIFVRDTEVGTTFRVSVASDGSESDGTSTYSSISADGRWVAFDSFRYQPRDWRYQTMGTSSSMTS